MRKALIAAVLMSLVTMSVVLCRAQDDLDKKMVPTGTFTGQVVKNPDNEAEKNWVYVQGPKGAIRKVDVATAKVSYAAAVSKKNRMSKPEDAIKEGARIRVTAMQEGGDWRATEIEILKPAGS